MRTTRAIVALLATALLAAAPAEAIYIMTPLHASASSPSANVGDTIVITVRPEPENETARADWAGKTVVVHYAYDTAEGQEGLDEPTSDETYRKILVNDTLVLDENARASFEWTVPAEVDDRNVAIQIESDEGELLAIADIGVGDAPPRLMAAAGPGGQEPVETPMTQGEGEEKDDAASESNVPAPGLVAILALAGTAALISARRGRVQ